METRTALIGIVVEDGSSVDKLNSILHDYKKFILGRMGLPHPSKEISIISIAMEAPADTISALGDSLSEAEKESVHTAVKHLTKQL